MVTVSSQGCTIDVAAAWLVSEQLSPHILPLLVAEQPHLCRRVFHKPLAVSYNFQWLQLCVLRRSRGGSRPVNHCLPKLRGRGELF